MPKNAYWLYGHHAVAAALANPRREVRRVLATKQAQTALAVTAKVKPQPADASAIDKLLPKDAVHQGIAAEVLPLAPPALEEVLGGKPLLMLDQVTDPHNVGAILRSAAAFGAGAVIVQDRHSPPEGGVMAKAASGALEVVPLVPVTNLSQALQQVKEAGYWCAGLDGDAPLPIHQAKLGPKTVLVLGAEGRGLRRLVGEHCDLLVKIPISGQMESLNVSNAAAVALYALRIHEKSD